MGLMVCVRISRACALVLQGYGYSAWDSRELHQLLQRSTDWKDVLDRERDKELAGGALAISTVICSATF
jgi:hypothetical protein